MILVQFPQFIQRHLLRGVGEVKVGDSLLQTERGRFLHVSRADQLAFYCRIDDLASFMMLEALEAALFQSVPHLGHRESHEGTYIS